MTGEERLSEVLSEFARTMVTDFPIQGILDRLVERIVDILPVSGAGVTLIEPDSAPRYVAASDDDALQFERLQAELDEGPCLEAYRTGLPVEVPDLAQCREFPLFTGQALQAGLRAVFSLPLHHGNRRLGALDLYRRSEGAMSAESLRTAATLADVTSAYLSNAQARHELQVLSDQTRHAALHDALTGLPNRVLLIDRLNQALQRSRRSGFDSALLYIDLDRFKAVNDSYGHSVGDALLIAAAERLAVLVRPHDTLVRLAGDEFVVLCEDLDDPAQADHIAARLQSALQRPFDLGEVHVQIGASVGIAYAGHDNDCDADLLLHNADMAMYAVKRVGLGRHESTRQSSGQLLDLGRDLPTALARREFHLEYQPIVDCGDGGVVAVEALLRWLHPVRGPIGPRTVIPLAEHSGAIHQLGDWVLERALHDAVDWQRPGRPVRLAVNVAPQQLMSAGFAATLAGIVGASGFPADLLMLEIPESSFLGDSDRVLTVLREVRDVGVSIAMDNFGTGRSSFLQLRRYPIGTLKIDPAFTSELGLDPATDIIAASMVALAHDLGMTVVAAGVETADQHRRVRALGCDACQGYRFSRPVRAEAIGQLLTALRPDMPTAPWPEMPTAIRPAAPPLIPTQLSAADLRSVPQASRPPSAGDQLQQ